MTPTKRTKSSKVSKTTVERVRGMDKKGTGGKLASSFASEEAYEALPPVIPNTSKSKKSSKPKRGFSKASLGLQVDKGDESEYEVESIGDESFLSIAKSPVDKEDKGEEDYEEEAAEMLAGASGFFQHRAREIVTEAKSTDKETIRIPPGGNLLNSIQFLLLHINAKEGTNYHVQEGRNKELIVYSEGTHQSSQVPDPPISAQQQSVETKTVSSPIDEVDHTMTEPDTELNEKIKEYAHLLDIGVVIPCKTKRAPAKITSSRSGFDRFSLMTAVELNHNLDFPGIFIYLLKRSPDFKVFRAGYRLDRIQYPC